MKIYKYNTVHEVLIGIQWNAGGTKYIFSKDYSKAIDFTPGDIASICTYVDDFPEDIEFEGEKEVQITKKEETLIEFTSTPDNLYVLGTRQEGRLLILGMDTVKEPLYEQFQNYVKNAPCYMHYTQTIEWNE